jgi:hypothetical protein
MEKINETVGETIPQTGAAKKRELPTLEFYANHKINFEDNDIHSIEYYAITELRKIPIPEENLLAVYDSVMKRFRGRDLSKIFELDNWSPVKFRPMPGVRTFPKVNVVTFGPMAMHLFITPHYIKLPGILYEYADWYSPDNKELVQIIRSYYHTIITHFGGDHALYVDERKADKYYTEEHAIGGSALLSFEQTLKTKYGPIKKPLFSFPPGKYPKYYIDTFVA